MLSRGLRRVLFDAPSKLASHRAAASLRQRGLVQLSCPLTRAGPLACTSSHPRAFATDATPTPKPKRTPVPRKKPVKKAKKKTAAKRPKKKAAKKAKKAAKPKKVLTAEEAEMARAKVLRSQVLTEPKPLPENERAVFLSEELKGKSVPVSSMREVHQRHKNLAPADIERLNRLATENRRANQDALQAWVRQHTPRQIYEANLARSAMRRIFRARKARGVRQLRGVKFMKLIPDERAPKRPATAFSMFHSARWASGDFQGIRPGEAMRLSSQEWHALSPSEKQVYEDRFRSEMTQYKRARSAAS